MRVLVTGGGTGGHIYPALAFVEYVKETQPDADFLYIGAKRGLENKIVPETGIPFETLEIQGFKRKLSPENFRTLYLFFKSIKQARKILKKFKPDVVIGTGGYVSGAVVYAAAKMNIPTIIHEQNSVPGITNKFLSRYVDKIGLAFESAKEYFPNDKSVFIGNPRAQTVATIQKTNVLKEFGLDPDIPTVLVFGGSQGAYKINQAMIEALPIFAKRDYQVLYGSGERYYQELEEKLQIPSDKWSSVRVVPYIYRMAEVMASVDLLVSRAGATTIAEFTALGLPAVLIPSPYVTNDHQTKNAQSLVEAGAVDMLQDQNLTGSALVATVDQILLHDEKRQKMETASKKAGVPDASIRMFNLVQELINK